MKLLTSLLAAIVLFVSFPADSFAVWFDASWTYRVSITIDADQVNSTLTNFPVYVDLSDLPADFHTNVKSDGCDIRVVESDETTETAFELVDYDDATDTGELHFMADSVDGTTDTVFYIYYGNAAASCYGVTDTYGRNAVWGDYLAVLHLKETSGATAIDSTGNMGFSYVGSLPRFDTTLPLGGQDLDGVGDWIESTDLLFAGTASSFTYQAWLNLDTLTADFNQNAIISEGNSGANNTRNYLFINGSTNEVNYDQFPPSGGLSTSSGYSFSTGVNTLVHTTLSSNTLTFYKNGSASGGTAATTENFSGTVNRTYIGANYVDGTRQREINGKVGAVRITTTVLPADWITTEYNNQSSPSTFYAVGTQETNGGGERKRAIQIIGYSQRNNYIV